MPKGWNANTTGAGVVFAAGIRTRRLRRTPSTSMICGPDEAVGAAQAARASAADARPSPNDRRRSPTALCIVVMLERRSTMVAGQ
jgi:hypothetical protein